MQELLAITRILEGALTAINAASGALSSVNAIVKPAVSEGRQLNDEERSLIAKLANDQAEKTKAALQAIIDQA